MLANARRRRALLAVLPVLALGCAAHERKPSLDADKQVARGCPPERAQNGEVRLVFLGDSGYGQGFSEWGTHGQDAIAQRLANLALPPDLVFFLGDNIYPQGLSAPGSRRRAREESRGTHSRSDHGSQDDARWRVRIEHRRGEPPVLSPLAGGPA